MVSQCLENNRTDPLTCICRWIHERTDLWWYVWGSVSSGTVHQKHNTPCFTRDFRVLTVMRSENHSPFTCCSWLSSKNDNFVIILDDTSELRWSHIKNTRSHRQDHCFWFLSLYVELYFHTLNHIPDFLVFETRIFCTLSSETMWYPHILIQLLTVLILLQPHIHFSSCSSLHHSRVRTQYVTPFLKNCVYLVNTVYVSVLENRYSRTYFYFVKRQSYLSLIINKEELN